MHTTPIKIFRIAQTRMNSDAVRQWLDHVGAAETPVPIVSELCPVCNGYGTVNNENCGCLAGGVHPEVTDAGAVCGLCAKRCYMSFEPGLNPNVTRVRKEWHKYLSNIVKSGHGSVLEHASFTYAIEGVSRVFTGEMNRHRAGVAISEGSMRYIRFDDIGFWMPISLEEDSMILMPTIKCDVCTKKCQRAECSEKATYYFPECASHYCTSCHELQTTCVSPQCEPQENCPKCHGTGKLYDMDLDEFEEKKAKTRDIFKASFEVQEATYTRLCKIWGIEEMKAFSTKKKLTSLFRRLIGMGVATGGTWTMNMRALRHILALRTTEHAEEEIAMVCSMIAKDIVESEPAIMGDFVQDDQTGAWVPKFAKV